MKHVNVESKANGGKALQPVNPSSADKALNTEIQQQLETLAKAQRHHKQELKENMTQMRKQIKTQSEQVTKGLTYLFHDLQKSISEHLNQQLNNMRTQFNVALGWRFKHHYTELLRHFHSVLTPVSEAITHLHAKTQ